MATSENPATLTGAVPETRSPEFLVVSSDVAIVNNVAAAVRLVRGILNYAARTSIACGYIARRRIDGIFVDMTLPASLELLHRVRHSSSNRAAVIFAYLGELPESQPTIRAGANFVLQPPLLPEKMAQIFTVAAKTMATEKRRYFRYPLMVPVELQNERLVESTMSNLSEGGMAIWSLFYLTPGSPIDFAFEVPFGGVIRGRGEVAWTNADGLAGIRFRVLPDSAYNHLSQWFSRRDESSVA